jgi:hypothetical protein
VSAPLAGRDHPLRVTPYELVFPDGEAAGELFREIREEAAGRAVDPGDSGAFLMLAQVGRILRELAGGAPPEALVPTFGPFLFQAFHFHAAGTPAYLVEMATLRYLLEADAAPGDWTGGFPSRSGYLQLPRHLVWARPGGDGAPPEALDGLFWTRSPSGIVDLLAVSGIRGDRPGFSVLPVPPLQGGEIRGWLTRAGREEGEDFATTLPGGELDRLYSVETAGELVKLAARILAHAATVEDALGPSEGPTPHAPAPTPPTPTPPDPTPPTPMPGEALSRLPFRRIRLGA